MSFRPIQREVDGWISQFREGYFEPLPMLARLVEEVGELARVIMHRFGGKPPKPNEDPGDLADEIADAIFVLVCLANSQQIDLDEAFAKIMRKFRERDAQRWTPK